ncbi:MAG: O-acetylhomoserine aminocarboxypropyltransferase [Alphaproteobacteria bacterium]|jgi:O-acetylhomoserine (thiol)-lyase|nr:O-acetylhomoserine aminocarboxypropyltransferase [Alphaproteobacteria bacterium]
MSDDYKFDTLSLHAGHVPDAEHGSRAVPIHQTTSYVFRDSKHAAALYNMELGGHLYTRISNPTVAVLEQRVAALDDGVAATATASGMAALTTAVMTICSSGDHIVASSRMYGANINLLENTLPRFGITTTFVAPDDLAAIEAAIQPNTKIIFGEVIGNPGLDVMDVAAVAEIGKKAHVPLMLDCTFNTPWLLKPITLGANIIIHSLTKWMGGHGIAIGGAVVDGGNFDWGKDDRFPTIAGPHYAMNEINFHEEFGPAAFTAKFRAEGMYNFGPSMSPTNAFHILQGIETLPLRMQKHMDNTAAMLEFLSGHDAVAWVKHPTLPEHPSHELVKQMLPKGAGSIIVFGLKGGRDAGKAFIEAVELSSHLANVGDAKTLVIHPASTTHSHISAEAMVEGGLSDDMIRLSVGLEDITDITADFEIGFRAAARVAAKAAE